MVIIVGLRAVTGLCHKLFLLGQKSNCIVNFRKHSLLFFQGLDKIEFLQSHDNQEIYQKAFDLIEHYFGVEDEDSSLAPQVDQANQQFLFPQQEAPMEGFQL